MVTQGEFDQLARRVLFLEKDNARLADRIRKLEDKRERPRANYELAARIEAAVHANGIESALLNVGDGA